MLKVMTTSGGGHVTRAARDPRLKVAVIGDKQVGKSSLISRYVHDYFSPHYTYTHGGDMESLNILINDHRVHVTLVDAAGHRYARSLIKSLYRNVHGVMVVYDVTRDTTLQSLQEWLTQVELVNPNRPIIFLVGNKQDLTSHRSVDREQAEFQSLCLDLPYFETSAKTGYNVRETFTALLRAAWRNCSTTDRQLPIDAIKIRLSADEDSPMEDNACCLVT